VVDFVAGIDGGQTVIARHGRHRRPRQRVQVEIGVRRRPGRVAGRPGPGSRCRNALHFLGKRTFACDLGEVSGGSTSQDNCSSRVKGSATRRQLSMAPVGQGEMHSLQKLHNSTLTT